MKLGWWRRWRSRSEADLFAPPPRLRWSGEPARGRCPCLACCVARQQRVSWENNAIPLIFLGLFLRQLGKKSWKINDQARTLTPSVEVRILLPQPIDIVRFFSFLVLTITDRSEIYSVVRACDGA